MNRKPVSHPELRSLGNFQGQIERFSNFRAQALNHNLGRNVRVVQLLAYLGLMRRAGIKLEGHVECAAAIRQNFSSTGGMEAAHYVPGQVYISGQPVWQFGSETGISHRIEFLFAEVEHLPAPFNHADSEAEAKGEAYGLCAALTSSINVLLRQPRDSGDWLRPAYENWQRLALVALHKAYDRKSSKEALPPLAGDPFGGYTPESIAARSTARSTLCNRDDAARILSYYLEDQQQRGWPWVLNGCHGVLADVERAMKDVAPH